jgi:predicted tellurium resistance membrane protein TerC
MQEIVASLGHVDTWVALITLSAMEVVLGIDNVVFIAILVGRVEPGRREKLRKTGLVLALGMRLGLLFALTWLMGLTAPLFTILNEEISGRDLILLGGGLFLIGKSVHEMHGTMEGEPLDEDDEPKPTVSPWFLLAQIAVVDIVFSLDSVITAVGMAKQLWIMVAAMLVSVAVMLVFAKAVGDFVDRHPTVKVLALSFLILIGVMLCAEGLGQHISKGYIYFAMAFALAVEMVNMRLRKKSGFARPVPGAF